MGLMAALLFINPVLTTQAAEVTSTVVSTTATVTGSALKIRQNASNGATVIGIASKGESFTVTGVVDNEWLSVSYKGRTAYIASDYVTLKTVKTQIVTVVEEEEPIEAEAETAAEAEAEATENVARADENAAKEAETAFETPEPAPLQQTMTVPAAQMNVPAETEEAVTTGNTASQVVLLSETEGEKPEETQVLTAEETEETENEAAQETEAASETTAVAEESAVAADSAVPAESLSGETEETAEAPAETEETGEQEIADEAVPAAPAYSEEDLKMLAALIYCEAVGESYEGKLAVGEVVLNRVASTRYPDSISGVIYDAGQFTPVSTGKFARILANGVTDEACLQAAAQALAGSETIGSCTRFNRVKASSQGTIIGNHVFWG